MKDSEGWRIPSDIDVPTCEHINKGTFGWDMWRYYISNSGKVIPRENLEEIEIIGLCTDICVVSNALILRAVYPESEITVDAYCCAGVTPETHKAALDTMRCCQIKIVGE